MDRRMGGAPRRDALTGILDRRAGKEALREQIARGKDRGETLVLCMLGLNGTQFVNERYGRAEGDRMIVAAAAALSRALRQGDVLYRLGGDEFLAAFANESFFHASERIEGVLRELREAGKRAGRLYEIGFCYGMVEIAPECGLSLAEMLHIVDEKQYEQKRRLHIRREAALAKERAREPAEAFVYDRDQFYEALAQSTDDYIYICNMKTGVFRYSQAMVEEFALPGQIVPNAAAVWGARVHPEDQNAFLESNQEITDGRADSHCVEYRAKNRRGEWVWLRCRGCVRRDAQGEPELFAGVISNLDQKNKLDHLTGLKNKIAFENDMEQLLQRDETAPLALLMLDFDDFKRINDLYDRLFGDEVLRIVSHKFQTFLPPNAALYRFYGDEFGVVFRRGSRTEVQRFFDQLSEVFRHQQVYDQKKFHCALSGGCAFFPRDAANCLDLVKYADYSVDYAKRKGKKRLVFFSEEILAHKERTLSITELLRESIERNFAGFALYFQPIVNAGKKTLSGAEALLRWHCAEYGALSPLEFIPLLEKSGMILQVGRWIFEEAVRVAARWSQWSPDFRVNINLSYLQMEEDAFYYFMEKTLQKYELEPGRIVLELTESYIVSNMELLMEGFRRIREMGMKIAMDDFGTGYSSLGILKQSPADIVKIDRMFVRNIQNSSFDLTFIRFVVALCHDVGIRICLEGVETEGEYETVCPMNLDFIQGYLFGRPMPEEEFERAYFAEAAAARAE